MDGKNLHNRTNTRSAAGSITPAALFLFTVGVMVAIGSGAGSVAHSFVQSLKQDIFSMPSLYSARILRGDEYINQYNPGYQQNNNTGTTKGTSKTRSDSRVPPQPSPVQQNAGTNTQPANTCGRCSGGFICYQGECMSRAEVQDLQRQQQERNVANQPKPTSPFANVKGNSGGIQGPSNSLAQNIVNLTQNVTQGAQNIVNDTTHVINEIVNIPGSLANQQSQLQSSGHKPQQAETVQAPYCARNCIGNYTCSPSLTGGSCVKAGGAQGNARLNVSGQTPGTGQTSASSLSDVTGKAVGLSTSGTPVAPTQMPAPSTETRNTIVRETATPSTAPSLSHIQGSSGGLANNVVPTQPPVPATETRNTIIAQQTPTIQSPTQPSLTGAKGSSGSISNPLENAVTMQPGNENVNMPSSTLSTNTVVNQEALNRVNGTAGSNQLVFINPNMPVQYTVVTQQTLQAPQWQNFVQNVQNNSNPKDLQSVTNAVNQALPYNPDYASYISAANQVANAQIQAQQNIKTVAGLIVGNQTALGQTPLGQTAQKYLGITSQSLNAPNAPVNPTVYSGEVGVWELLSGHSIQETLRVSSAVDTYLQPQNRELSAAIANGKQICFEQAIAEYMYLSSVGVTSEIISVPTVNSQDAGGTVLLVHTATGDMIVDPADNVVAPKEQYLSDSHVAQGVPITQIQVSGGTQLIPSPSPLQP